VEGGGGAFLFFLLEASDQMMGLSFGFGLGFVVHSEVLYGCLLYETKRERETRMGIYINYDSSSLLLVANLLRSNT